MVNNIDKLKNAELLDARPVPTVTYQPMGHLIAVHQLKLARTRGGILLPTGAPLQKQHETLRALVIVVGPEVTNCKAGDVILISDSAPSEIVVHKDQVTVVLRDDCFHGIEMKVG